MKIINIPGMHCDRCVDRISVALSEAGLNYEINLPEKTVAIKNDDIIISKTMALLEDLGFEPK